MKPVWNLHVCLVLYWNLYETCMYCLVLYWNLYETCMYCLVLSDTWFFQALIWWPWFCLPYKRGVLYPQTVPAQILSLAITTLTRPASQAERYTPIPNSPNLQIVTRRILVFLDVFPSQLITIPWTIHEESQQLLWTIKQ